MVLKNMNELKRLVEGGPRKRLVLAAAQDQHSLGAIIKAWKENIIEPILVGDKEGIESICESFNYDITGVKISAILLRCVLNKEWGLRTGNLLSHFALFEVDTYPKVIAVTDVAMNIAPSLQDKIAIVNNSVACLNRLGYRIPKVAVLGAVEMVNENMQATLDAALLSKMNQRDQIKNCIIDGPLAFDNAVSLESAQLKGIKSEVAGDTDLLLMPDIEVGNVLYKSLVFFAKAKVASIILGASVPIVLTSRSDSEQAKFDSILLAAAASR